MSKKIFPITMVLGILLFFSCADDELSPIITFDKAGKGAYVKLVEVTSAIDYDLAAFSSTSYDYRVEFIDVEGGNSIEQYEIFVSYQDNTPINGDNSKVKVSYKTFSKSDFSVNENGQQGISVNLPLTEAASTLGLSESDMSGADFVIYFAEIVTSDGAKFGFENSTAPVNGSAFGGHHRWSVKLNCPLSDSQFAGSYKMTYVEGEESPVGGVPVFGEETDVTVSVVSQTKRKISVTYLESLAIGNGPVDIVFEFVCSIVAPDNSQESGLRCGSGILFGQPKAADLAAFNLDDDSVFDLAIIEDVTDDCGAGTNTVVLRFTKN